MACVNCGGNSDYLVNDPGANPLEFCSADLPDNLRDRANAGHFKVITDVVDPEPEPKKK
jgi:hypothetical protein